jgi:hypothetical protein
MLITNQTNQDYWFGPLHLAAGIGQTLTIDDSSATSLYLLSDDVADAVAYLQAQGKITVGSVTAGIPFPRATGMPDILHGDGVPEGLVYASYGSLYLRRDAMGPTALFTKTTGVSFNTGWVQISDGVIKPAKLTFSNTTAESDFFGTQGSGVTIPANYVEADSVVRVSFGVQILNNSGASDNFTLRAYLGATKWYDSGAVSLATSANPHLLVGEFCISMQNAMNAEWAEGWAALGSNNAATAGFGNPLSGAAPQDGVECSAALAVDLTQAETLRITGQWGTASNNSTVTTKRALVEVL